MDGMFGHLENEVLQEFIQTVYIKKKMYHKFYSTYYFWIMADKQ